MTTSRSRRRTLLAGLLLCAASSFNPAHAADDPWPTKPVRLVVPFAPGGSTDVIARMMAQKLSEAWGQTVVVDNRAGAGGTIGADNVAKSPADGYTLLLGTTATQSITPSIYPKLAYDPLTDFTAVAMMAQVPVVLVVNKAVPARSIAELIALAREKPDALTFASSGTGAIPHLTGELFKVMAGVKLLHVPYRGATPALTDLLAGQVSMMFDNLPSSLPHITAGSVNALGVATRTRARALPDVPTIAEAGVPGFEVVSWFGILAPAGTPAPIVAKLRSAIEVALVAADFQARLAGVGAETMAMSQEDFAALIRSDAVKWAEIVKANAIKPE